MPSTGHHEDTKITKATKNGFLREFVMKDCW